MKSSLPLQRRAGRAFVELGALGPLALLFVVAPAVGAVVLAATGESWFEPLARLGLGAVPWFLLATVVLAGSSLVPTHAASLVAGMLFGALAGSALALVGVCGAAFASYLVLRSLTGERARTFLDRRPRAAAVHRALVRRGAGRTVGLIALVRLSPVMPFAGTNLLLAAAGVGPRAFLLGSAVGLAPRIVLVALAGAGLAELDLGRSADLRLAVVGALATIVGLVVLGRIARRALRETALEPAA